MKLEITTHIGCPAACPYCPQELLLQNYSGPRNMLLSNFILWEARIPRFVPFHFSGFCEPFANSSCIDMIEISRYHGRNVTVYTNALMLNVKIIERLAKMSYDKFMVHAPNAATEHEDVQRWIRNVNNLNKYGVDFTIVCVEGMEIPHVNAIVELLGCKIFRQPLVTRAGNLMKHERISGEIYCADERQRQNVLLPNGDIYLCCNDYGLKHCIGNIDLIEEYGSIHRSPEYKKVVTGFFDDTIEILCRYCERAVPVK